MTPPSRQPLIHLQFAPVRLPSSAPYIRAERVGLAWVGVQAACRQSRNCRIGTTQGARKEAHAIVRGACDICLIRENVFRSGPHQRQLHSLIALHVLELQMFTRWKSGSGATPSALSLLAAISSVTTLFRS